MTAEKMYSLDRHRAKLKSTPYFSLRPSSTLEFFLLVPRDVSPVPLPVGDIGIDLEDLEAHAGLSSSAA